MATALPESSVSWKKKKEKQNMKAKVSICHQEFSHVGLFEHRKRVGKNKFTVINSVFTEIFVVMQQFVHSVYKYIV